MESAGIATSTGSPVAVESATAESKVSFMGETIGEAENSVNNISKFILRAGGNMGIYSGKRAKIF
jgi:hypothetical protein